MKGLILRLKKRHQDSKVVRTNSGYIMWGFYDQLAIFRIESWNGLEPIASSLQRGENGQNLPAFHEEYPLKLIEPQNGNKIVVKNSNSSMFSYDQWDKVEKSQTGEVTGGNFLSIGMVHFTKKAIQEVLREAADKDMWPQDLLNIYLQNSIITIARNCGISDEDFKDVLKCSTYHTTGFGDMIILFQTARFDWVSDIVFGLREQSIGKEKILLVSTSYLISGSRFDLDYVNAEEELLPAAKNLRLSIRFLLKPGVSPRFFYEQLSLHVKEKHKKGELLDFVLPEYSDLNEVDPRLFSQMYGFSDVLLLPDVSPNVLLKEYSVEEGFLNPNGSFFGLLISSTRTSLRRVACKRDSQIINESELRNLQKHQTQTKKIIKSCMKMVDNYYQLRRRALLDCGAVSIDKMPRLQRGMVQVLNLYRDLAQPYHAYDLCCMLDPVVEAMEKNINQTMVQLNRLLSQFIKDSSDSAKLDKLRADKKKIIDTIKKTDESLQLFRHEFNELLLDLLRADRQFIEGRGMLHGAVGSATKLILAYNRLLQKAAYCLEDTEQHSDKSTYDFLLSSGGTDRTESKKLFDFLDPVIQDEKKLENIIEHVILQVRLPERTLFRVGASVFLLMHEMLHVVGYRGGNTRFLAVQKSIVAYTTHMIAKRLYSLSPSGERRIRCWMLGLAESEQNQAIAELREQRWQQQLAFERQFTDEIIRVFEHEDNQVHGIYTFSSYLSSILRDRISKILAPRFYPNQPWEELVDSVLTHEMANKFYNDTLEDGALVTSYLESNGLLSQEARLGALELSDAKALTVTLQAIFDVMLNNKFNLDPEAIVPGAFDWLRNEACLPNVYRAIDSILDAYREALIDVSASNFLNCKTWQYLSIYLYENEVPVTDVTDPLTPVVVLRFGSVLYHRDERIKELLEQRDDRLFRDGLAKLKDEWEADILSSGVWRSSFEGKHLNDSSVASVHAYVLQIEKLLVQYRDTYRKHFIAQPLEQYLAHCIEVQEREPKPRSSEFRAEIGSLFSDGMEMSSGAEDQRAEKQDNVWNLLLRNWLDSATRVEHKEKSTQECKKQEKRK